MQSPRGVLLDVDGTLIDSNDAHARSWMEAFRESGLTFEYEEVRRLIGKGGDKLVRELTGWESDTPRAQEISERRKEIFLREYLPALKPFPRVRDLLERMKRDGMKLVIATSAQDEELEGLMKVLGATDLIGGSTSSDDAERSKPDPDIVAAAFAKIHLPKEQVVMLGDTPYDVQSAGRAGIPVIALRCGGWNDDALAGAIAIYDDPADLLDRYEESPLGSRSS
jgi:HAD superfamily hydrolase (TIGR01549 family)